MKKALAVTLSCILIAGVMGGCSGNNGKAVPDAGTGGSSKAASTEAEKKEEKDRKSVV